MKRIFLLSVIITVIVPTIAYAQYVIGPSVLAGGGARLIGGGYVITGTTGQSAPIGISNGGSYITQHGFWYAVSGTGGGGLSPMVLDIDRISPSTVRLSWQNVVGATSYDLYRNTTPFFNASGSPWQTVSAPTTQLNFSAGVGNPNVNYFFIGIARNASQTSQESNRVGEFDYLTDILIAGQEPPDGGSEAR